MSNKQSLSRPPSKRMAHMTYILLSLTCLLAAKNVSVAAFLVAPPPPFTVHMETSTVYGDERTCYEDGQMVAKGAPAGCGRGCQYAELVQHVSSDQGINGGLPTSGFVVGPPDAYPSTNYSTNAWSPLHRNSGFEELDFSIATPVVVSRIDIYENYNPGAVIGIYGRASQINQWIALFQVDDRSAGADNPANGGTSGIPSRIFIPPISAPRNEELKYFRIELDTRRVSGFNQIDAIKVHGSLTNGAPVNNFVPPCVANSTDCFYTCTSNDVMSLERIEKNLLVAKESIAWLEKVLRVNDQSSSLLLLQRPYGFASDATDLCTESIDPIHNKIEIPERYFSAGLPATDMMVLVTSRQNMNEPISSKVCSADAVTGRPTVMHLNIVPGYYDPTSSHSLRAATDVIVKHFYRILGWNIETFQIILNEFIPDINNAFAGRHFYKLDEASAPNLVAKASSHLSAVPLDPSDPLTFVELDVDMHLSSRVYYKEVMTADAPYTEFVSWNGTAWVGFATEPARELTRSAISLALLQDTTWFLPNYDNAEILVWGRMHGRDVATKPCNEWPASAHSFLCPIKTVGLEQVFDSSKNGVYGCTYNRKSKGTCTITTYPSPLPEEYRYFDGLSEAHLGGPSAFDYCPVIQEAVSCSVEPISSRLYEEFGDASRCFISYESGIGDSTCHKHTCKDGNLYVKVYESYYLCPSGDSLTISNVRVECPNAGELCEGYQDLSPGTLEILNMNVTTPTLVPGAADKILPTTAVSLEVTNFAIPTDGYIEIKVNDNRHVIFNETFDPLIPIELTLTELPVGEFDLNFQLVQKDTNVVLDSTTKLVEVLLYHLQYVESITFASSELDGHPASAMVGNPEVGVLGPSTYAWSPKYGGRGFESVEASVAIPMYIDSIDVYSAFGLDSLARVEAVRDDGNKTVIWSGQYKQPLVQGLGPKTHSVRLLPYMVKSFELVFHTPPWDMIDAVRVGGYLTDPAQVSGSSVVSAPATANEVKSQVITLTNTGGTTLYWEATLNSTLESWLSIDQSMGSTRAGETFDIPITIDTTKTSFIAGEVRMALINIADRIKDTILFDLTAVLNLQASVDGEESGIACYNGQLVPTSSTFSSSSSFECRCDPGSYGIACEFKHCPHNCTAVDNGGTCDRYSGQCACNDDRTGLDCSGYEDACYIPFQENCRTGWVPGTYTLSSDFYANLNRATGAIPRAMACDTSSEYSIFGCDTYVDIPFCCRSRKQPDCAFMAGSSVCADPVCSSDPQSHACTGKIIDYCFYRAEDPACNSFSFDALDASFCPDHLALELCASDPSRAECEDVIVPISLCGFESGPNSPCNDPSCVLRPFSDACRPIVEAYCSLNPSDRECEFHSLGDDGCLFASGSTPCTNPVCGGYGYSKTECDLVVRTYCEGGSSGDDIECIERGYGTPFAEALPKDMSSRCPWSAIYKQCELTPSDASCIVLSRQNILQNRIGDLAETRLELDKTSVVVDHLDDRNAAGLDSFTTARLSQALSSSLRRSRFGKFRMLFEVLDVDGDRALDGVTEMSRLIGAIESSRGLELTPTQYTTAENIVIASASGGIDIDTFLTLMDTIYL